MSASTQTARLGEVHAHYTAGDTSLAHRRLLDVVMDTGDRSLFRETLQYLDWQDGAEGRAGSEEDVRRATEILQKTASVPARATAKEGAPLLRVRGLGKRYTRGTFALSGVDVSLDAGGIIGLVGENGNGKTTLLRLVAGELAPDAGTLEYPFFPHPKDRYNLRSRLVYIEQRIPKWYGSLQDNLRFVLAQHGTTGESADLRAELMVARIGLRPYRTLTWGRLSSGYRTRFEIAKALLRSPHILLLDEPLANLDIVAQQTLLQDLRFMSASATAPFGMLLSSQHIYEVEKVSDSIIFLKKGAPQYGSTEAQESTAPLIIEVETEATREALTEALRGLPIRSVQNNGGVFLLQFSSEAGGVPAVMAALAAARIDVVYLRNISNSSRRFFLSRPQS